MRKTVLFDNEFLEVLIEIMQEAFNPDDVLSLSLRGGEDETRGRLIKMYLKIKINEMERELNRFLHQELEYSKMRKMAKSHTRTGLTLQLLDN